MNELKGNIFNIQRFSVNDGPGIRTTIFFKGCPLKCEWCHNPECFQQSSSLNNKTELYSLEEILTIIKKDIIFYEQSGGGVTFSGGEPLLQTDFLLKLLLECRRLDIHTAVDTCGYTSFEHLKIIAKSTDLFLYDLKIMNNSEHIRYTGVSNKSILKNLKELAEIHKNIIIRVPLIPDITDTSNNMSEIVKFISDLHNIHMITLLPYNELCRNKYIRLKTNYRLANLQTQPVRKLNELSDIFISNGYQVQIRG